MKREYWNKLADCYEDEVFNVLRNDRNGIVLDLIRKYGSSAKNATDYGCGVGRWLPCLCETFSSVLALDISRKCIDVAKTQCPQLQNVEYRTIDLTTRRPNLPKTHFALSVNTLIMPSLAARLRLFDVMVRHTLDDGHLLLVVPALESAMFADFRLIEWNLRSGLRPAAALRAGFCRHNERDKQRLHQGIVLADNVPTKHYLREELIAIFQHNNLRIKAIHKVEYSWKTEFDSPPGWMQQPYPWDWLVIAQKPKQINGPQRNKTPRNTP